MHDAVFDAGGIPSDVVDSMKRIHDAGHGVWIVGGAIRSSLLGQRPKDWDLATDAPPGLMFELFARVVPTGIRHGTVQVLTPLRAIEVTTFPGSGEEGIAADLGRRDFTVNAMAWAFPEGSWLDPHGGVLDLSRRILRAVGHAPERFREDPLRTLRAGRFVSTDRFVIEERTFLALQQEAGGLRRVAPERVRDEWIRLLMGENVEAAMDWMLRGGVVRMTLPELLVEHRASGLAPEIDSPLQHALSTMVACPHRVVVRLSALFHNLRGADADEAKPGSTCTRDPASSAAVADVILVRWKASRRDRAAVVTLIEHQLAADADIGDGAALRRNMARVGRDWLRDWIDLAIAERRALIVSTHERPVQDWDVESRIQEQVQTSFPMSLAEVAVKGADVMAVLNLPAGPEVGRVLRELHAMVLADPSLNRRKFLMDFIRKAYHK